MRRSEVATAMQRRLPSNIFIQFLAGPKDLRGGSFGWLLRAIGWVTLVIAPVLLLLLMQVQFLPFHSSLITWTQRIALIVDLVLIWWLWGKILSGREVDDGSSQVALEGSAIAFVLSLLVLLFSVTAATFPGEWQEDHWPDGRPFLANGQQVSLHDWVFNSDVDPASGRRRLPFSSTLVLTGFNVFEGRGIDESMKAEGRDFVFRARGRDLRGAIFHFATLRKIDFVAAKLQGARFESANLEGASFGCDETPQGRISLVKECAQLQDA